MPLRCSRGRLLSRSDGRLSEDASPGPAPPPSAGEAAKREPESQVRGERRPRKQHAPFLSTSFASERAESGAGELPVRSRRELV